MQAIQLGRAFSDGGTSQPRNVKALHLSKLQNDSLEQSCSNQKNVILFTNSVYVYTAYGHFQRRIQANHLLIHDNWLLTVLLGHNATLANHRVAS